MFRASVIALLAMACVRVRPVEAPVIDVGRAGTVAGELAEIVAEAPTLAVAAEAVGLIGRWEGVGAQDDGMTWPFSIEITSVQNGICGIASYPTLRCLAEWECTGFHDGVLTAEEHLREDGATRCIDDGSMTIRARPDGALDWHWTGQGQNATSTLRRAR